ncbi:helix-turn-helix domain-containing protein [Mycolicibacterium mageritense]|uniref:AraC family transcriptional regulator n=1 Tax=Mycolicibacterium mageritense TaxID=53462 RepID=A0ABM7HNW4_MYCME|nr:helix-turn-helix transcriptional regulator [Mycolicibacterium mageritense]MCC9181450.1 helix-turn-helix transcriptional regulator [Mycolicibacterium mageritense]BBX32214.1 AraC family transcriptional regulator [Mycolicibacterium mageritense]CDO23243.1 AraC family transcriptional regulator [Mycolicibacterium mageritense DSM 44476 = CIP 104973]
MTPSAPAMFRPCAALAGHVEFFGYWERSSGTTHRSRALPRGAATVIIDLSARQRVDFFAADGTTRLPVSPAFVAGAGSVSYVTQIDTAQTVMTIHFRPGAAVLSLPLGELENRCVGLAEVWGRDGIRLHEQLIDAPSAAARIALAQNFLLCRLTPRRPAVAAVLAAAERDPGLRVSEAAELTGLSAKRLITQFRSDVGLAPKAYLRVRRLQAALRRLDTGTVPGAEIAADLGYFDQAHFVRDFRSFTAMTPTQYAARRMWLPSHVGLAS